MKTFYSVNYRKWGSDCESIKWFDNLEEAKEFASRDYTDKVVVHNIRDESKIAEIETEIQIQNY